MYTLLLHHSGKISLHRALNIFPSPSLSRLIAPNQKTSNRARRIVQPRGVSTELQRTTREKDASLKRERGGRETEGNRERELMRRRGKDDGKGGGMGCTRGSERTSSDFSAVAAASERAALLCTSSLMASPVQPWLGSVLYHTAGRVPSLPPSGPSSLPPSSFSAASRSLRSTPLL